MPHCIIEYPHTLDTQARATALMQAVFNTARDSNLFNLEDIKTRIYLTPYAQRAGALDTAFVHITCKLLSGRTTSQKQELAQNMFHAVKSCLDTNDVALSVAIQDMDKDCFIKGIT